MISQLIELSNIVKNISSFLFPGSKLEHMMALRDEVEQEYADRMEDLRNMYRVEMDALSEKADKEKEKMAKMEGSLQESLKV